MWLWIGAQDANLSLMRSCTAVQVEEAVAVSAQVATHVTQDDGSSLPVIMIITHGLEERSEERKVNVY